MDVAVVCIVLAGIGAYFRFVKHNPKPLYLYLMLSAVLLLLAALLSKTFRDTFSKYWMKLGEALGYVNSKIILSIIFLLVLLPMVLLRKLFSKSSGQLQEKKEGSMWVKREHTYGAGDLEKMW